MICLSECAYYYQFNYLSKWRIVECATVYYCSRNYECAGRCFHRDEAFGAMLSATYLICWSECAYYWSGSGALLSLPSYILVFSLKFVSSDPCLVINYFFCCVRWRLAGVFQIRSSFSCKVHHHCGT